MVNAVKNWGTQRGRRKSPYLHKRLSSQESPPYTENERSFKNRSNKIQADDDVVLALDITFYIIQQVKSRLKTRNWVNSTQIIWSSVNSSCRTRIFLLLHCSRTIKKKFRLHLHNGNTKKITTNFFYFISGYKTNQQWKRCWFVAISDVNGTSTSRRESIIWVFLSSLIFLPTLYPIFSFHMLRNGHLTLSTTTRKSFMWLLWVLIHVYVYFSWGIMWLVAWLMTQ